MAKKADPMEALMQRLAEQGLIIQRGGHAVEAIPTGIASFDLSTGVGGIPRRRVSIFQGEEGSGKTLLLLLLIAQIQRSGGAAAFVDLEHALTPDFARLLGVDYDGLMISKPRTMEEAYDVARPLCHSGLFDVVGFDSAVALASEAAIDKSARDGQQRAAVAQVHSEELPKIVSTINERTAFVLINQQRENPNPPTWWRGGKQLYSPGGRALRHHSSMTIDITMGKVFRDASGNRVGHVAKTYVSKNKVAQPFRRAEFDIRYDTGVDPLTELIAAAMNGSVLTQSSSWFYLEIVNPSTGEILETKKWNGRAAMEEEIRGSPTICEYLSQTVKSIDTFEVDDA